MCLRPAWTTMWPIHATPPTPLPKPAHTSVRAGRRHMESRPASINARRTAMGGQCVRSDPSSRWWRRGAPSPDSGQLASGRAWAVGWGGGRCVRLDPSTGLASGDKVVPQSPPVGSEWSGVGSGVGGVAWLSAHSGPGGSKTHGDPSCTGTRAVHGHGRTVCAVPPAPVGSEWSGVGSGVGGVAWLSAHSGPGGSKTHGDPSCTGTRAVHGHGRTVCARARSGPFTCLSPVPARRSTPRLRVASGWGGAVRGFRDAEPVRSGGTTMGSCRARRDSLATPICSQGARAYAPSRYDRRACGGYNW